MLRVAGHTSVIAPSFFDARILIVDDQAFHLGYLERFLRSAGYLNI